MKNSFRLLNGYKAKLLNRVRGLNPTLAADITNLKLDWYTIKDTVTKEDEGGSGDNITTAEILIYDEIGGSFGVSAEEFANELNAIEADRIDIRINSPGGSLFDSIAIYNSIVRHPAYVTTYVDGYAASAASIIAMAGDECVMMVGSQMMIHDALVTQMGNAQDFREMADFLDRQSDNIADIYKVKAGGTRDGWREMMLAETWMFADEAVNLKLADSVYTRPNSEEVDAEEIEPADVQDAVESADVEAAMQRKHRLTNRGYKYTGREKAPSPDNIKLSIAAPADDYTDAVSRYLAHCK